MAASPEAQPDAWHLPCAYWFWHRIPTPSEIRGQLGEMRAAGIMSFQVQARLSMPMSDYLTSDYLAAYRMAVDEAAAHDMMVGIYDDYNWQSGHAAGRAVAGHPELAETHLFWTAGTVDRGQTTVRLRVDGITSSSADLGPAGMHWHYHDARPRWADWTVRLGVVAPPGFPDSISTDAAQVVDVTPTCEVTWAGEDACELEVSVPAGTAGQVTAFVSARCDSSRLVNHMDPAAVRRFIEVGYQPIADALGAHMGTTVTYLFFDQPHPNFFSWAQHQGQLGHAMPVSEPFLDHLHERWGKRLGEVLLTLLAGESASARSVRCNFYDDYGTWARESFLGTVHDWTSSHGLALTGHEVLPHVGGWALDQAFRTWDLRVNFGLDFFSVDAYRDLTGCDAQDATPQLSPKMADSAARANGRSGTMLEQYYADAVAGTGHYTGHWGLTPGELRDQTIRHHLAGMRQQIMHGFYLTDGHDDDPTMFSNPRFDFPPGFNFEPWFTRYHSQIAQETGRLSHFLDGMEPQPHVALVYPLRAVWADGQNAPHAALFGRWAAALTEANVAFRIVDESLLVSLADESYRAVVLAGASTVCSRDTLTALRTLAQRGLEIIVSGSSPSCYQSGSQRAEDDWADLEASLGTSLSRIDEVVSDAVRRFRGPSIASTPPPSPVLLVEGIGPDGAQRAAAFNPGPTPAALQLSLSPGTVAVVFSAASGEVVSVTPPDGDRDSAVIDLAPGELILIDVGATAHLLPAPCSRVPSDLASEPRAIEAGWTVRVASGNPPSQDDTCLIQDVDLTRGLEVQGLPAFSGIATYATTVTLDAPTVLRLTLPHAVGGAELYVNGHTVGRRGWAPYVYTVPASATVEGANHLLVEVAGTAANRYYADTGMRQKPEPSGLIGWPSLELVGQNTRP